MNKECGDFLLCELSNEKSVCRGENANANANPHALTLKGQLKSIVRVAKAALAEVDILTTDS